MTPISRSEKAAKEYSGHTLFWECHLAHEMQSRIRSGVPLPQERRGMGEKHIGKVFEDWSHIFDVKAIAP